MNLHDIPAAIPDADTGKRMILVTATYPFGPGESFLTAELECIAPLMAEIEIVPSFRQPGATQSFGNACINLDYAQWRWGKMRRYRVLTSAIRGILAYDWRQDLKQILSRPRRLENLKELVRALYRARMFASFLERKAATGRGPDIVYFYWMVPEIMGAIAWRRKTGNDCRIVARAHRTDLYAHTRPGGYFGLRSAITDGVDAVYCISAHGQDYLSQMFPALGGRCRLARLGVPDPGFLNPQPDGRTLSIVSCSFISEVKRVEHLVDALACLADMLPGMRIEWTHIGNGPLFDRVSARAREILAGRIELLFTGHLQNAQILELYRKRGFDVFINVSKSEGLPVTLMEAASVGLPMIATDVGGSREIVNAGNGIVLPANPDVHTIASAMRQFTDKEWAKVLRGRSRACWKEKFDATTNHRLFARALLERKGQVRQ